MPISVPHFGRELCLTFMSYETPMFVSDDDLNSYAQFPYDTKLAERIHLVSTASLTKVCRAPNSHIFGMRLMQNIWNVSK